MAYQAKFSVAPVSNLGIQGVFKALTAQEIAALRAQGYKGYAFGEQFLGANRAGYSAYVNNWWSGYQESDYEAGKAARNLSPIPLTEYQAMKGLVKNYYGFPNPTIQVE